MKPTPPSLEGLKSSVLATIQDTDWYPRLGLFLRGNEFDAILQEILHEYALGYRIGPPLKHVFRAFRECSYEKMKVFVYTDHISEYLLKYDGIAFSQSLTGRADNTLKQINRELKRTYADSKEKIDLSCWAQQGVLMLPHALTTIINQRNSHVKLWAPLFNYLWDIIQYDRRDVVVCLVGEGVWERGDNLENVVLKYDDPQKKFPEGWNSDIFLNINEKLKDGEKINW